LTEINARTAALRPTGPERGASAAGDGENMRGKKVALAVIVLMLIAGGAMNHFYVPEMDVADDPQTQVTEAPGTTAK
jgi:hypothetical protein